MLQHSIQHTPDGMSEESPSPRAGGRAAGGHTCTPEEEGPTPPAFALVAEVGSMGDDAGPEQLDWGSIDDEDGAFGQLSEASNIQDSDPPLSGGLLSGERQVPAADEPIGGAGGAVAITSGASAAMHSSGELEERELRGEPAAGCSAQQGILQGADLDFPGAPKSSKRQVFIARSSIVHQAAAGLGGDMGRPQSGPLHGPASELADSPDSAAGQSASAGADGPLPDGATPNTSVRETDRGAQSRSVEDTALNAADTALLCGDSRGINATADSVAEAGTRNHGRIKACVEYGFFYVINHGIERALLERVFANSRKFFEQTMEEKMALGKNSRHRGYTWPYSEKVDDSPESRELFPSWKKTMQSYHANALATGKRILSLIALSLDLDAEFFHKNGAFEPPSAFLRLLHYAGDVNGPDNKDIVGAAAHSDYGMLTLLATDGTPGLQICREKDRHPQIWEDVHHIDGSLIVNIGDLLERWTNCVFRSTLHRVVPVGKERYSVAFFIDPSPNLVVKCMESCCSEAYPARFAPIKSGDYIEERLSSVYKLATS